MDACAKPKNPEGSSGTAVDMSSLIEQTTQDHKLSGLKICQAPELVSICCLLHCRIAMTTTSHSQILHGSTCVPEVHTTFDNKMEDWFSFANLQNFKIVDCLVTYVTRNVNRKIGTKQASV